jgi:LPXTG-motif cell wall-anchored protein
VPDAPTDLVATPGDESTIIAFTIGNDNGSPITDHEVSVDDGPWRPVSPPTSGSPVVVDGLANGETYEIRLRSVNGVGPGLPSDQVRVTPAAAPTPTPTPTPIPTPIPEPDPSGGGSGSLPATGANVGGLTGVGLLLVVLGSVLAALWRRSASVPS